MFKSDGILTRRFVFALMFILLFGTLFLQGCIGLRTVRGTGDMISEEREVGDFSAIEFSSIGTVLVALGEEESLQVEGEDNLLRYIETEVRDQTLHIEIQNGVNIIPTQSMIFHITAKDLEALAVSGVGNIDAPVVEAGLFAVAISGGGDINIEGLEATQLEVDISGLGNFGIAEGAVESQEIAISGGGNYNAREMTSGEARVNISGLGSATIWVTDRLDVDISGGGSVRYIGNPTVEQNVSGLGRVEHLGE